MLHNTLFHGAQMFASRGFIYTKTFDTYRGSMPEECPIDVVLFSCLGSEGRQKSLHFVCELVLACWREKRKYLQ